MKKIIIASAAITALLAGQAMAATNSPGTGTNPTNNPGVPANGGGGDGAAQWYIYGSAASYCVLGQGGDASGDTGNNVTIDTTTQANGTTGGNGYDGSNSDGSVKINQLQGPNDRQNNWNARIRLAHSVCNTGYTVTAKSANGGLTNPAATGSVGNFTNNLDYRVRTGFSGNTGVKPASTITASTQMSQSALPDSGNFIIEFDSINTNKYLVAGNYSDNVLITLTANTGGAG